MICDRLERPDIARLIVCSKVLRERLEPILYSNEDDQKRAMIWACHRENLATIRLAVSHGVSPNIVLERWPRYTTAIGLAAKKRHTQAVRLLVDLGGRVLPPGETDNMDLVHHFRRIVRHLSSPHISPEESSSLIHLLYDGDAVDKRYKKAEPGPDTALPINTLILSKAGPPLKLIQRVVDEGADLNKPRPYRHLDALSPLSAAIIANLESVCYLLLERGADIHGTDMDYLPRQGLHLPIFAASRTLAVADHGRAMVQFCLDHGANINHHMPVMYPLTDITGRSFGKRKHAVGRYTYTTPLLVFLDSIESFKSPNYPDPVEGLSWLFEHGAEFPVDDPSKVPANPPAKRWGRTHTAAPTGIDLLIDKWGLRKFAEPRFAGTIKLLVHRGVSRGHVARLLLKYDRQNCEMHWIKENPKTKAGRDTLTAILLESPTTDSLDDVLSTFIIGKPRGFEDRVPTESAFATIERLIETGANINARIPGRGSNGPTALHDLCVRVNTKHRLRRPNDQSIRKPGSWVAEEFIPFLIDKGANPTIPVGEKGETAIDALLAEVEEFQLESAVAYVKDLADMLRKGYEKATKGHTEYVGC